MVQVYRKKQYSIYSDSNGNYIIHNRNKEFKDGHTHINNFNTAKFLVDLSFHKTIPMKKLNIYLYDSLIRISNDNSYINRIMKIKEKSIKYKASMRH